MKIIPFTPPQGPRTLHERSQAAQADGRGDFEKALHEATASAPAPARDAVGSENVRALESASEGDLNRAAGLLSGLLRSVGSSTPEALARMHRLDGVLYFSRV
jgi:hypothetical protein